MSSSHKITADYSSIVCLKHEILRKRLKADETKKKNATETHTDSREPRSKLKVRRIKTKNEDVLKGVEIEEVSRLEMSKLMLEAKSKLYDKLQKSQDNLNNLFLIDFPKKYEEETAELKNSLNENCSPDNEWVDYKDCFGRTRRCLRKDLPKMLEEDNLLKQNIMKEPSASSVSRKGDSAEPHSSQQQQSEIEIMRQKWQEQTKKLAEKANIYYQDILFDEARTHGVGYYNFSINEEERAKQQANLEKMRRETEEKQREMQALKEKKAKMEQNRLRVARLRQRIRAGLPAELTDEEQVLQNNSRILKVEKQQRMVIGEGSSAVKTTIENNKNLTIIEDKVKAFGELLGKRSQWRDISQEEWIEKKRKDRFSEYAPVYDCQRVESRESSNSGIREKDGTPLCSSVSDSFARSENMGESANSDYIGPISFEEIPLSEVILLPPLSLTIPPRSCDEKISKVLDPDRITEGLRYLREKFENDKKGNGGHLSSSRG